MAVASHPDIQPLSEDAVLLSFGRSIDPALTATIAAWCGAIRGQLGDVVTDVVPSYTSIIVYYDFLSTDYRQFISQLRLIPESLSDLPNGTGGRRSNCRCGITPRWALTWKRLRMPAS